MGRPAGSLGDLPQRLQQKPGQNEAPAVGGDVETVVEREEGSTAVSDRVNAVTLIM